MASEMPTHEQKLLFCFMKAIVKDICMFDAVSTAEKLSECGIPCDVSSDAGRKAQCLALLEFLHAKFSHTMLKGKRQKKYAIFRVIVGASHQNLLQHFSLSRDSTYEDIDRVYKSLRSLDTGQCEMLLKRMLVHCKRDKAILTNLLAASSKPTKFQKAMSCSSSLTALPWPNRELPQNRAKSGLATLRLEGLNKAECGVLLKNTLRHNDTNVTCLAEMFDCCKDRQMADQMDTVSHSLEILPMASENPQEDLGVAQCGVFLRRILSCGRSKGADLKSLLICSRKALMAVSKPSDLVSRHFLEDPQQIPCPTHVSLESQVSRTQQRHLTSGKTEISSSSSDTTGTNFERAIFEFAYEKVGADWRELGVVLGFKKYELNAIEKDNWQLNTNQKAWEMLNQYVQRERRSVTIEFLDDQLAEAKKVMEAKSQNEKTVSSYFPSSIKDDPSLVGRDSELQVMEQFFWDGKQKNAKVEDISIQKVQVLSGVGGVGKTSLQNRYAFLYHHAYSSGVFHFNSESSSSLFTSLEINVMAVESLQNGKTDVRKVASLSQSQRIHLFHEFIRRNRRSLILFDSADSLQLLKEFLPAEKYPCHILISTRQGEESKCHNLFQSRHPRISAITSLENESAVNALLQWSGHKCITLTTIEQRFARQLACSPPVEGLPLALAHAGTLVKQRKLSFRKCWELLDRLANDFNKALLDLDSFLRYFRLSHLIEPLMEAGVVELRNLKSLSLDELRLKSKDKLLLRSAIEKMQNKCGFLTWEMDLDDLERDFPEGYLVMSCFSLFASRRIPQEVVRKACFGSDLDMSKYRLEGGIRSLNEYSLIQEIEENDSTVWYNVHHLIQQSMVERLYKGDLLDTLKRLVNSVQERFLEVLPSFEEVDNEFTAVSVISLSDHIYSVSWHVLHCNLDCNEDAYGLPLFACRISLHLGSFLTTVNLGLSLISTLKTQIGSTGANKCLHLAYNYMAAVYQKLNDQKESVKWMTKACQCKSTEKSSIMGIDFQELFDRAILLLYDSHFDEAENLLLNIVERLSAIGFSILLHYSRMYYWLSLIGEDKSDYNKQLEYLEKGLELSMRYEVPEGLQCADYYHRIGECVLIDLDDPLRALPNFRKALGIVTSLCVKENLRISHLTILIAQCEMKLGRFDKAVQNSERGLKIAKSLLPSDSYQLVDYLKVRASILSKVERFSESYDLYKESLTLIVSNSSRNNRDTRSLFNGCIDGVFICFNHAGNFADFVSYLEELMAVIRDDHPSGPYFKANVTCALANAYMKTHSIGRFQDAAERMNESLKVFMKECPASDQTLFHCAYAYAFVLARLHRFQDASDLLKRMATTCSLSRPQVEQFDECWGLLYQLKEAYPNCANGCIHRVYELK